MTIRDREMIASPESWPARPRLPLVRLQRTGNLTRDIGYLVEGCGLTVFIGNIFMPLLSPRKQDYQTLGELLTEWRVD